MAIRERPEDCKPGDSIHSSKLVDKYLKDHPEEECNRAELLKHANIIGMVTKTSRGKYRQAK